MSDAALHKIMTSQLPSQNILPPLSKGGKRGPRGGVYDPFPIKLHRMLDEVRAAGLESVVSWLEHGRAFRIHQPKVFAATIMCRFFNQSKYTSFQRQLNLYGFSRCVRGPDGGAYHHPSFLRGKAALALNIIRTKIKGNGHKTMAPLEEQPDFHKMVPLKNEAPPVCLPKTHPLMAAPVSPTPSSRSSFTSLDGSSVLNENESTHLDEINKSIFMHELAMGCTILCKLRQDDRTV
mmetsp:Transcript_30162/g.60593  ORF Transcript_30162/g.60593 Transcript_30162/m.60593 type:complete len:235 (-) Transcript_30162:278-982(-)